MDCSGRPRLWPFVGEALRIKNNYCSCICTIDEIRDGGVVDAALHCLRGWGGAVLTVRPEECLSCQQHQRRCASQSSVCIKWTNGSGTDVYTLLHGISQLDRMKWTSSACRVLHTWKRKEGLN